MAESPKSIYLWARSEFVPIAYTLVLTIIYVMIGASVMLLDDQELSWNQRIYFMMVTMSTVGYGDISPSTPGMKAFMVIWQIIGIVVVFSKITGVVVVFTREFTGRSRAALEALKESISPSTCIDIDGDGVPDFKVPEGSLFYYTSNLLPSVVMLLVIQLISAAIFIAIEDWNYGDAVYHCMTTATTVGYGDMSIDTDSGRVWASVHIFISVAMLGEIVSTFDTLRDERKQKIGRLEQLNNKLDPQLVERLLASKRPGQKFSKNDWVQAMLVESGAVQSNVANSTALVFEAAANGEEEISAEQIVTMVAKMQDALAVSAAAAGSFGRAGLDLRTAP